MVEGLSFRLDSFFENIFSCENNSRNSVLQSLTVANFGILDNVVIKNIISAVNTCFIGHLHSVGTVTSYSPVR